MFMDNLLAATPPKPDQLTLYVKNYRVGWVAVSDIAAMAAAALYEGPEKYYERDYWMSTDVLNGSEVAAILSEVTDRSIAFDPRGPGDFKAMVLAMGLGAEPWYTEGGVDFMRQVVDGRMGYIGTIRNDIPFVLGRPALTFRDWANKHKDVLVKLVSATDQ